MNGTSGSSRDPSRLGSWPTRPTDPPTDGRSLPPSVLSMRRPMLRIHGTFQMPFSPGTRPRFGVPSAKRGVGPDGGGAPRCATTTGAAQMIAAAINRYRIVTLLRVRQACNHVEHFIGRLRAIGTEMRPQIQLRAPVLPPRCRFRHDRLDADGAQRLGHFFHLARPSLAVQDDSADHVVGELLPVDAGKAFVERG